jgi:hypothetical protein
MASNTERRRVLIEGWRSIHHSYALVAQSHCLCLLQHDDVDLRFRDLPFYSEAWKQTSGIFAPDQERALAGLAAPDPAFAPEATLTLRPESPDFGAPRSGRKFAFGTAEYRILTEENRHGLKSAAEVADTVDVVTPSRWTALAFERFGMPAQRIHVVPHGIDPAVLRPDAESRIAVRKSMGLEDHFVYLSVGAMTWNKGLDVLLTAFARVVETEPGARLLLKGADGLYPSRDFVREPWPNVSSTRAVRYRCKGWRIFSERPIAMSLRTARRVSTCRCSRRWPAVLPSCARPAVRRTSSPSPSSQGGFAAFHCAGA